MRLRISGEALVANWRTWARLSGGAACGAAIKADGYGLDAREAMARLSAAGCRDFFVASWAEAAKLADVGGDGAELAVLHGVREEDMGAARGSWARPVLVSAAQVARWRGTGRPCDVMVDTGMNRLGLTPAEALSGLLDGLEVHTLHSHLACADDPGHPLNAAQAEAIAAIAAGVPGARASLANSAGVLLGSAYHFALTRPGLALYGGVPAPGAGELVQAVVRPEAQILQVREVPAGSSVGYGADWVAVRDARVAVINLGYADGILRAWGPGGVASVNGRVCPAVGRVSMDLIALDVTDADAREGDWATLEYDLPATAARTGLSQYELLTNLAGRFDRHWA